MQCEEILLQNCNDRMRIVTYCVLSDRNGVRQVLANSGIDENNKVRHYSDYSLFSTGALQEYAVDKIAIGQLFLQKELSWHFS